ncbi:tetratricopeptide repeat protein [Ruminococcus sp. 5_1_39BFAA]|uniref:tetratricopeptide repeat protein n=1 Tax=Ruminococcus sp. 5_1_39BFAA TaxID=457412 RepID=UPI00356AC0A7
MKFRKTALILAVCIGTAVFSGCDNEKQKIFEQAGKNLEQGSYEYALQEYAESVNNQVNLPMSYRGMGIANLRLGNYEAAIESFTNALGCDRVKKSLEKDLYTYRATARFLAGLYEDAMADCQMLAQNHTMDADCYFLTGKVALAMDAYDEAANNFEQSFGEDSTYDRAIQIYEVYLEQDMEADGSRYLEAVLASEPKGTQDICDRGRIYYYMDDYANARQELTEASNQGSTEALLLLGMVYMAQNDYSNARAMYQQFVSQALDAQESDGAQSAAQGYNGLALCDIAEGNYDSALENISSGISFAEEEEMQSLLFNEVVAYEKKLDFATALQKVQAYLEIYPDDEEAKKEMAFLKTRTGV